MLSNGTAHLNGHGVNDHVNGYGHMLECPSDYEERPAIDVVPTTPAPLWRNQYPLYTHNLSWQDGDGCNHSLTLRSDSITDLLNDLKMVKVVCVKPRKNTAQSILNSERRS